MKILAITNLYPNALEPARGVYNKQQIEALSKLCEIKVVAPLPWNPKDLWQKDNKVPAVEAINGIPVYHPRYFMTPKVGRSLYGYWFYLSLLKEIKGLYNRMPFDVIYATWAYPDAFGSYLIAKSLNVPIVIKVHGTDINLYTKYLLRRKMIVHALNKSQGVIAVSNALKQRMVECGVNETKITVIGNGVDTEIFKPLDKNECRNIVGLPLDAKIILFVGNLVSVKGLTYLLEAFKNVKGADEKALLVLVGDGDQKQSLRVKAAQLGVEKHVIFAGRQSHERIPLWMNACDVFCLPSISEGCPNVLLEALACGKQVVGTRVGGIPDMIGIEENCILVSPADSRALGEALKKAVSGYTTTGPFRSSCDNWKSNARRIFPVLEAAVEKRAQ